eukprot:gene14963-biopygen12681
MFSEKLRQRTLYQPQRARCIKLKKARAHQHVAVAAAAAAAAVRRPWSGGCRAREGGYGGCCAVVVVVVVVGGGGLVVVVLAAACCCCCCCCRRRPSVLVVVAAAAVATAAAASRPLGFSRSYGGIDSNALARVSDHQLAAASLAAADVWKENVSRCFELGGSTEWAGKDRAGIKMASTPVDPPGRRALYMRGGGGEVEVETEGLSQKCKPAGDQLQTTPATRCRPRGGLSLAMSQSPSDYSLTATATFTATFPGPPPPIASPKPPPSLSEPMSGQLSIYIDSYPLLIATALISAVTRNVLFSAPSRSHTFIRNSSGVH